MRGNTHGAVSHTIKHYDEFEPAKVATSLKQALQKAYGFSNFFLKNTKAGEIISSGDKAKKSANENDMLNTFDLINDKEKKWRPFNG